MRRLQALLLPEEFKAPHAEPPLWSLRLSAGRGPAICLQRTPADKCSLPSWEMQGWGVTQNPPGPIPSAHSAANQGPESEDVVSCSRQTDRQTDISVSSHTRQCTENTSFKTARLVLTPGAASSGRPPTPSGQDCRPRRALSERRVSVSRMSPITRCFLCCVLCASCCPPHDLWSRYSFMLLVPLQGAQCNKRPRHNTESRDHKPAP